MALFWAGVEIVTDTSEQQRVNLSDIFVSPWCCNSSYEDRYDYLIQQMYNVRGRITKSTDNLAVTSYAKLSCP